VDAQLDVSRTFDLYNVIKILVKASWVGGEQMYTTEQVQNDSSVGKEPVQCIKLRDGTSVTIRGMRSSDVDLILEMHQRLSKESIYFRYLSPYKPTSADLERQCSMEGKAGFTLVAITNQAEEQMVGLACYRIDKDNPNVAEPAILVEDNFQGRGIGKQLISALFRHAVSKRLEAFISFIDPANRKVFNMVMNSGLPYICKYIDGMKEIRMSLSAGEQYLATGITGDRP